jgi:outer membrane receptor protein involved in Fe transport
MKKQFALALLSCTAMTWANAAPAQTAPQPQPQGQPPADVTPAQQTAPAPMSQPASGGGQIVVTGTRIVRNGYTAPTPVTVATTEELVRTTPSSIPDALNKLPQFQNSLSAAKSAANFSNIPIHGNVLNLRGLGLPGNNPKGPLRTLILFDGIRVPPTEYVGTIDSNVLPELLMQRVDVVTGGASAQWGSDAVAGVVNFILDKKFVGIKGVAQYGLAERGYNHNQRVGLAGGMNFDGDRGHILISGDYFHNDGMLRQERAIGRQNWVFVGANTASCAVANTGLQRTCTVAPGTPGNPYVALPDIRISALAATGRIVNASFPAPTAATGNVSTNPVVGRVINPDGTTRPFDLGTAVGTTGFQQGGDGYFISPHTYAVTPTKSYQTFGRVSYDIFPDVEVYAQGVFSRAKIHYITQTNSLIPPTEALTIFRDNPFLPAAIAATLPTSADSVVIGQQDAGQPQPTADEKTDFWMATAGVDGKLKSLNWNFNYTHGSSTHDMENAGLYENQKLYAAADAVLINGTPTCRVLTLGDPTLNSRFAGCTPINPFHGDISQTTPAGYDYVTGTSQYRAKIKQDGVQANLSGSLFELPAGPIDFAVGAEWRKQSLDLTTNADPALLDTAAERNAFFAGLRGVPSSTLFYWLTNVGAAKGSVNVKEAYGELAVPIVRDTPGFQELSINGAGRITDYSTSGTVETWKLGLLWRPIHDVLFRVNRSRDIRAPNLFELFAGPQSGIGIINNPQTGTNVNANTITSGNPNLKPEIAKTLTVGGVFSPQFFRGFSASVDYYRITVKGMIETLGSQQIVNNCFNAGGSGVPECDLIDRDPTTGAPTLVRIAPANIAFLKTQGIDFDATYRMRLWDGDLSARLYANYVGKFDAQQYTGAPISHYAGVNVVISNPAGYPKWRGNLTLDYAHGPFGITISEQYINHMRLDIPPGINVAPAGQPANIQPISFVDDHVPSVWYTDLSLRAKLPTFGGNSEFFLTVNNLFDKDPPLIPGTIPGVNIPTNIAIYDFIGRAYTAGVRFRFGGAPHASAAPPPPLLPPPPPATQTCANGTVIEATATCPAPAPAPPPPPPAPAPQRG